MEKRDDEAKTMEEAIVPLLKAHNVVEESGGMKRNMDRD